MAGAVGGSGARTWVWAAASEELQLRNVMGWQGRNGWGDQALLTPETSLKTES